MLQIMWLRAISPDYFLSLYPQEILHHRRSQKYNVTISTSSTANPDIMASNTFPEKYYTAIAVLKVAMSVNSVVLMIVLACVSLLLPNNAFISSPLTQRDYRVPVIFTSRLCKL